MLLTKEHILSTLLVLDKHERNCHSGGEQTLSLLRESVRIIKGKTLVRMVIQNCSFCKQRRVTPQLPIMSNLPDACLAINQPPFTNTRIDHFGPLTINQGIHTRSTDRTSKRYGAVFTSLSTRAVHIELVGNLSIDNFMLALHRFLSMRRHPKNKFWQKWNQIYRCSERTC